MTIKGDDETAWRAAAREVLVHYPFDIVRIERVTQGLINLTLRVQTAHAGDYVLQRLNPVFSAQVNDNIAAVTEQLTSKALLTPRLVLTRTGAHSVTHHQQLWRMMTWIDGCAFDALQSVDQAKEVGQLLARFHQALLDFSRPLVIDRAPIHDFARHRAHLAQTVAAYAGHRLYADVLSATAQLDAFHTKVVTVVPNSIRVVHGDPKISNFLFDPAGITAIALVDLDTLARMPLALELGDAFRSWCNPHGEDAANAEFEFELFESALTGYAAVGREFVAPAEAQAIAPAILEMHLELAARFLADALNEAYFGWDGRRYSGRGEHNLARALGQLRAAKSLISIYREVEHAVARNFPTP